MIKRLLSHPLMCGREVDDPQTTELRKRLIHQKKFLEQIYIEWYKRIKKETADQSNLILEIGSGAGFLDQFIQRLLKTEVFYLSNLDAVLNAEDMPFQKQSVSSVVMTDVFHHLPNPKTFLSEVIRILPVGGKLVMIEPWVSKWSSLIYPRFHHEPFNPQMNGWEFPSSGPLSGSNQALPWIVFQRDREIFEKKFPELRVIRIQPMLPFRYLLSGGVSLRSFMPGWSTSFWRWFENRFEQRMSQWAMFALVSLEKIKNHSR